DLLARRGDEVWISLFKGRFTAWRKGSIAGNQRPWPTDQVLMADCDGDGLGDLVRRRVEGTNLEWAVYRGVGDGSFEPGKSLAVDVRANRWTVADFRNMGTSEFLMQEWDRTSLVVKHNVTAASSTSGTPVVLWGGWELSDGTNPYAVSLTDQFVVFDVDRDGDEDVLVRNAEGAWSLALFNGFVTLDPLRPLSVDGSSTPFLASDVLLGTAP
ncbi:MAG TPA: hypothetical protein VFZ61_19315, partial [Polyangiales bacterium]